MKKIEQDFEIMSEIDGEKILKDIELYARICYKSEDAITDSSAKKFVANLIKWGHESPLEHKSITVKFITDRGVTHEIIRHRLASYTQESTRYCVAGSTKLTLKNPHQHYTVEELFNEVTNSKNSSWKRLILRQYNESTGELCYSKIKNVMYNGEKNCFRLTTKLGYTLDCTADHKILTPNGYKELQELKVGEQVLVNGTEELYKNKQWLYHQNIELNKTFVQIEKEFGFNVSTLKKWAKKLGLPKKGTGYFNKGCTPWNKGRQIPAQVEALRTYHHCGRRKDKILKEDTSRYYKHRDTKCAICSTTENLEVHHIDKVHSHHEVSNLITLCESCHSRVHSQNLLVAYPDEIVSIKSIGVQKVYDIEMDSKYHNFVANGVVVHNCNYANDKFGNEISVVPSKSIEENAEAKKAVDKLLAKAEKTYMKLLDMGIKPQDARDVLPTCLKTEIVCTYNLREWRHFFKLRTSKAAHPKIRELSIKVLKEFQKRIPIVFDDIEVGDV